MSDRELMTVDEAIAQLRTGMRQGPKPSELTPALESMARDLMEEGLVDDVAPSTGSTSPPSSEAQDMIEAVHAANAARVEVTPDGDLPLCRPALRSTSCERCGGPIGGPGPCPAVPPEKRWRIGADPWPKCVLAIYQLAAFRKLGMNGSAEADAVRDELDLPWRKLSYAQRTRLASLSIALDVDASAADPG